MVYKVEVFIPQDKRDQSGKDRELYFCKSTETFD